MSEEKHGFKHTCHLFIPDMLTNIHLSPLFLGLQEERWQGGEKGVRCKQQGCLWHSW